MSRLKSAQPSSAISHSTLQSNYQKTTLSSGLRVVTEEIPYVRSVSIGIWVDVGSRDEGEETNGISHVFEHMVFKGTKRYSCQEIARSLESVGGYLNAFTTKEHTCFYARILDTHLPQALDVLSDLVQRPLFAPKELEKEKQVILEELKNIEDDPDDLIHDYFDRSVYNDHPLGYPIIGTAENIRRFTRNDLISHMRSHYQPGRMVIAAAGNLRHEEVISLVERHFPTNGARTVPPVRMVGPKRFRSRTESFEKPITQAHICLGTIGCGVRSRQRYPLLVLNTILGEGMSSRLFQNIRERHGFAYTIYSFANLLSDTGSFGVYAGTDREKVDRSIELIMKELEKIRTRPVTGTELRRSKAQLKGTMMLSLESMSNRMMRLGGEELYFGGHLRLDEILGGIDAVKVDDVSQVAGKVLKPEDFSTVVFTPSTN